MARDIASDDYWSINLYMYHIMKKLLANFWITILMMFIVALADYIIIPIGDFELGIGFVICWLYFGLWLYAIIKGKI